MVCPFSTHVPSFNGWKHPRVLGCSLVIYPDHSTNQLDSSVLNLDGGLILPINSPSGSEAQEPLQVDSLHIAQHQLGQSLADEKPDHRPVVTTRGRNP